MTIQDFMTWRNVALFAALAVFVAALLWWFGLVPWWVIIAAPLIAAVGAGLLCGVLMFVGFALWMASGSH